MPTFLIDFTDKNDRLLFYTKELEIAQLILCSIEKEAGLEEDQSGSIRPSIMEGTVDFSFFASNSSAALEVQWFRTMEQIMTLRDAIAGCRCDSDS